MLEYSTRHVRLTEINLNILMGWFCCVPGCSKWSEHNKDIFFHHNHLLEVWIHKKIDRKNLHVNIFTLTCLVNTLLNQRSKHCSYENYLTVSVDCG